MAEISEEQEREFNAHVLRESQAQKPIGCFYCKSEKHFTLHCTDNTLIDAFWSPEADGEEIEPPAHEPWVYFNDPTGRSAQRIEFRYDPLDDSEKTSLK